MKALCAPIPFERVDAERLAAERRHAFCQLTERQAFQRVDAGRADLLRAAQQRHLVDEAGGDEARRHRRPAFDHEPRDAFAVERLEHGIEIGTSFGPLHGKIWRIGTMGYVCRKENVLLCLGALEACLRRFGFKAPAGAGVDAALAVYQQA